MQTRSALNYFSHHYSLCSFLKKGISHNKTEKCEIKSVKIGGITFPWCCKILINLGYIKLVPEKFNAGVNPGVD